MLPIAILLACILALLPVLQGQGTPPTDSGDYLDKLEKRLGQLEGVVTDLKWQHKKLSAELIGLRTQQKQTNWVHSSSYCIFKKGDCPPGFSAVSLKTWVQRGASGRVEHEKRSADIPWHAGEKAKYVRTMYWEKERLGSIGDSHITKKCIKKTFGDAQDACFAIDFGEIVNEDGVLARPLAGTANFVTDNIIASNELVLTACCKQ